jgi:predicted Zn-dependent peptidase
MPFHKTTLPNGLTILGETSPSARSAAVGFFVRTGSRDEVPEVSGVTHYLEHMVFKGTPHRSAQKVNEDFDRIGADYNAFTSEENTVFHAAVLPEYLPQAIDILADILRPSLREEDFTTEKKVIINEIGKYEDQPLENAFDHARRVHYGEHKLGNSILGSVASITALTRDQMAGYFERRYVTGNILVAVAGHFDWDEFVGLVQQCCGDWRNGPTGRECLRETEGTGKLEIITKPKVSQQYVILMSPGPAADSPLRHAADLLDTAIGDHSGSRLHWELVDPGLADSAYCSYRGHDAAGAFYTWYSCEPEQAQSNLAIVQGILRSVRLDGISEEELNQARNKLLSRVVRGSERPKGRMVAVGMNWTYLGCYRSVDEELKSYEAVTLDDVRKVLDRYPLDRFTTLALGPLTSLEVPSAS